MCTGKAKISCGQSPMTEVPIINNTKRGEKTPTKASLITVSSCCLTVRQQFDPALVDKRFAFAKRSPISSIPRGDERATFSPLVEEEKYHLIFAFLVPCGWQEFNSGLHACKACKLKLFNARPHEKRSLQCLASLSPN